MSRTPRPDAYLSAAEGVRPTEPTTVGEPVYASLEVTGRTAGARLLDIAERTARTFLQGFLGVVTLDSLSSGVTLSLREKIAAGALAGAFAVLTAFASPPRVE